MALNALPVDHDLLHAWPVARPMPVLFRDEDIVPADHTAVGIGIRHRRPMRHRRLDLFWQLKRGPFLAAFDAGLYDWRPQ